MNIHPLFVHFPIALLVMYALMEITPRVWSSRASWWRSTKIFLVITGWVAAIPTLITGDMAGDIIGETQLVETHASMAILTVIIFAIPVVAYLIEIFEALGWNHKVIERCSWCAPVIRFMRHFSTLILRSPIISAVAFLGMIFITITGGLGASIAYGPDIDPIVSFIYRLFF